MPGQQFTRNLEQNHRPQYQANDSKNKRKDQHKENALPGSFGFEMALHV